jgi:acyl-CoA synthetase (AMP-forming)/AMP-acid ligase II
VAIFAANRWEWVICYWAILSVGAIPAALNAWWTPGEFANAADLVEPVLVMGDGPRLRRVAQAGVEVPALHLDEIGGILSDRAGQRPDVPPVAEDDPAVLIFTSGTTGRPKAVTVPHRAVVGFAQVKTFADAADRVAAGAPVPAAGDEIPVGDDIVLVTSPLFHSSMQYGVVLMAVVRGTAFVLLPGRLDPERVLATIERERVTSWMAFGSAGPRVSSSPRVGAFDTTSLRHIGFGGAPVSPAVQRSLRWAFPTAAGSLALSYGSTEAGAVVASIKGTEFLAHPTSTGRVTMTTQLELRDPAGRPVREGAAGEVHVRSPYLMLRYWGDAAASSAVLKDGGWLAMGDIACMQDGLLYIDSRARDLILVSAENVSPTEVEYCLEAHPDVVEAAVFGVDDDVTGDAVCAVLTISPGAAITTEDLTTWCRNQLAHYKVPTRWFLLDEPLPRTASGKVVKHALRAGIAAGGHAWQA